MDGPELDRRCFLEQARRGASALAWSGICGGLLAGCAGSQRTFHAAPGKEVRIPFKDYPELTKPGGMVKVETSKVGVVFVRAEDDGTFAGISAVCTHKGATINPTSDGFKCPRHGSTYDREGRNTGGPAQRPLARFPAASDGEAVVLKLVAMNPGPGGGC
jgi:Rieske Fe-S protein